MSDVSSILRSESHTSGCRQHCSLDHHVTINPSHYIPRYPAITTSTTQLIESKSILQPYHPLYQIPQISHSKNQNDAPSHIQRTLKPPNRPPRTTLLHLHLRRKFTPLDRHHHRPCLQPIRRWKLPIKHLSARNISSYRSSNNVHNTYIPSKCFGQRGIEDG
jgi:hypothetical protein